ncbi:drug/metabolite transporter (DMT)-like permease [Microbacteriaceae bacterium SG_E_30_P1]|uniref:Drug/metabolite transporter (DMT)-like permease n=1 Tax=Antiquaquibacter oligotrophicus TaxID=2880260 RepID=A0ABT6KM66_9MICO|nr:DMT family transporter [Antiquaquibacter oligotrophicus]MDH6181109.1 drug/metabolite transporter (DMT)-like permease [Antiquaquibacter oligotrophicus]UDF13193.1 DMT family transporter [Antiquaquibacter oligotrophicus]
MPPELEDIAEQLTLDSSAAIGIPLALVAAVLLAIGTQFQHRGVSLVNAASTTDGTTGLSFGQLRSLLARPSWVIGTLLLGVAIVMQLTSLAFAPLIVVQPLGAVALVVTAIVNARITKTPLDAISIRAIVICVVGIGAFVTIAAFVAQTHPITSTQLVTVLVTLAVVLAGLLTTFLILRGRKPRPIFYVIAGGVLFGFVVTLAKVVIDRVRTIISIPNYPIGPADLLTLLCIVGLIAAALLGTYFVQTAHSSNPPDLVVAGLTVIDPLVAVSIGIIVLGEAAGAPFWAIIAFVVAAGVAIYGVLSLARHHPQALANTAIADAADGSSPK